MKPRLAPLMLAASFAIASVAPVSTASAQDEAQVEDPQDDRATAFRAVRGPEAEQVPGGALLLAAYALVWVLLLLFVLRLAYLYAKTRRELDALERRLNDQPPQAPPPE
jgi:hypothetical protein